MAVLSVLRYCGGAGGAITRLPLSSSMIAYIRVLPLGKSTTNINQLIGRNNGNALVIVRQFGSTGKGQSESGARVSELIKHPEFRRFHVTPSRYSWQKYKDMFHFYFMLGFIPLITVVFLVNIFIGPPTLAIPEPGYEPKHWEYQRHPIQQFFSRYFFPSYQEAYERNLFYIREEDEKRRMRLLAWKAEHLMRERGDFYNYWGTKTTFGKYFRQASDGIRQTQAQMGDPIDEESAMGQPLDR